MYETPSGYTEDRNLRLLLLGPATESVEQPLQSLEHAKAQGWIKATFTGVYKSKRRVWHFFELRLSDAGLQEAKRRGLTN